MIDIQDLLHSMISTTCIRCYRVNFLMRILSFVLSSSIAIILNLSHQHQLLSLSRFVHMNLHQSVKHMHLRHLALRISTHVRFFFLTISSRISMHAHHHHLKSSSLHRHFEISHRMSQHRSCFESQRVSSRNCRNWTKLYDERKIQEYKR
jgi:hypothetical protein